MAVAVVDQDQSGGPWRWLWWIRTREAGYLSGCAADACGDGGELPMRAVWLPCQIVNRQPGQEAAEPGQGVPVVMLTAGKRKGLNRFGFWPAVSLYRAKGR